MLEYTEYKDLAQILSRSDVSNTYQDLMQKETQVLETVNAVVKNYEENNPSKPTVFQMSVVDLFSNCVREINATFRDVVGLQKMSLDSVIHVLVRGERMVYLGLLLVLISVALVFVVI
jgi:predicted RNase H-like HicB family nuclease